MGKAGISRRVRQRWPGRIDERMDVILGAEALLAPLTGIGNYTAELLRGLRAEPRIRSVRCFANYQWLDDPLAPPDAVPAPLPTAPAGPSAWAKRGVLGVARRAVRIVPGARTLLQRQRDRLQASMLNRSGASLYHEPNFVLRPFDGPSIATIHDLSVYLHPQYHPPERVEFMTRHLPDTFARASRLVTVSETVRQELIAQLGIAPERVVAIHNGVGPDYHPRDAATLAPALARLGLVTGGYLLAVGTLEPRKNFEGLLDAFAALPAALQRQYPLAVAGGQGWHNERLVERLDGLAAQGLVRRLGYVSTEALPTLYAGARAFAFPSFYEGFGLPVLEAAASGIPVLSSAASAMAEVLGAEGVLVDPRDPAALREGLRQILEDDALQDHARQAAPGFGTRFSWHRCVEQTVALYREVLN
jgi:glycosyltransferase involved in cell wall biosynthesis